jgi:ABC-2 type transport system permease protein
MTMDLPLPIQRTSFIARKEVLHVLRDPATLFFALFIPIVEMFMLGYAIDTNVRHVRTIVFDQARTQESRELLRSFTNSEDFSIVEEAFTDEQLSQAIIAGRCRVGVKIPEDYSRRLLAQETAQILILVDGSESSVAAEAMNVGNAIALRESLKRLLGNQRTLPVEARPQILFNPDTRSANFFIPGLMVVMCQILAVMMAANSIVREKEMGTIEQLYMTPVRPAELILGKLAPYLIITFVEFTSIAVIMRLVFRVPIHGEFITLLALTLPFVLTMLGIGLWISTNASTREAAGQMAMGTVIPSIFLSGYVFPLDSMPLVFRYIAQLMPTTWLIDAARGVILRGAGWAELWLHGVVLSLMAVIMLTLSGLRFHKTLT